MLVNLALDWFGPGGKRYRRADNPQEMPEELRDVLPTSAKILDEDPKPKAKAEPAPTVKIKI